MFFFCYEFIIVYVYFFVKVDIVFVYGFNGDFFKIWILCENGVYWFVDFLFVVFKD